MLRTIAGSDHAVKVIFDYFRNAGISAAVIAAGIWMFNGSGTNMFFKIVQPFFAFVIVVSGLLLFVVNELYIHRKAKEAALSAWVDAAARLLWVCTVVSLVGSIIERSLK